MKLNAVLVVFVLAVACGQAAAASPSFTAATAQHAVVAMSSALRSRPAARCRASSVPRSHSGVECGRHNTQVA